MFTDGYICSVVAPVIPYIIEDSSLAPANQVQVATSIIVACFGVSDIVGGPLCAWYIDTTSNRRVPFLAGLAFMATGTLLFGLGNALWILAVGRVVQGFASSILYTAGLAVLVDTVEKDRVGKWMGTAMSCNNIAIILSPVLGGIMYEMLGRSCVFLSMLALILVDATLRFLMVDKPTKSTKTNSRRAGLDEYQLHQRESVESEASNEVVTGLLPHYSTSSHSDDAFKRSATTDLSEKKPTITITTSNLPSPPPSLAVKPRRAQHPPPPSRLTGILRLIKSPRLLTALYGTFVNEALVASLCAILPLYASRTFHWSSLISGLLFLTIAIPGFGGPLAGHLADRLGTRPVAIAGFLLTAPSLAALRFVEDVGSDSDGDGIGDNQMGQKILLCLLLVISGFTIIFFLSPLGADLSQVADEVQDELQREYESQCSFVSRRSHSPSSRRDESDDEDEEEVGGYSAPTLYASTFSMMNCALATATVFGPLVTGGLNQAYGWKTATAFMGAMCLSGAVPCWFFTGQRQQDERASAGYSMVRTADDEEATEKFIGQVRGRDDDSS